MFVPLTTDAQLKHRPIGTVILIVVNIIVFFLQPLVPQASTSDTAEPEDSELVDLLNRLDQLAEAPQKAKPEDRLSDDEAALLLKHFQRANEPGWLRLALSHGDGLHPLQWLTSFFLHGGLGHLLGNMIFLWVFGMLVEGRIGVFRFVPLYLSMGIAQNMIEQIMFLGTEADASLGASSAIYAVMMIAFFWSPADNILVGWLIIILFRPFFGILHVPAAIMGACYFLLDFGLSLFDGFSIATPLLHVMGGGLGLVVGLVAVWQNWVDCEHRDLLSLIREARTGDARHPKSINRKPTADEIAQQEAAQEMREKRIRLIQRSMDTHLVAGNTQAAISAYRELKKIDPQTQWPRQSLIKLITELQKQKRWDSVILYSKQFLSAYPEQADTVRLNLARIYLTQKGAPRRCLKMLKTIDPQGLKPPAQNLFRQMTRSAQEMLEDGYLEIAEDDE